VHDTAQAANYINHFAILGDESWSMERHATALITAVDSSIVHFAERSKAWDQETRISFYTFAGRDQHRCLYYDKDVLRMPSIKGRYRPRGQTALIDCVMLALDDLEKTAQLYGSHAFMLSLFSDGQNNDSRHRPAALEQRIARLPENWTVAAFAPDQYAVMELRKCGFPKGNIDVWDTRSSAGMEEVGRKIRDISDTFMQGRTKGVHSYSARSGRGLFQLRDFNATEVTASLPPLTRGSYVFHSVPADEQIDQFVARVTGRPYQYGRAYYQFMKPENIQPQKEIAVEVAGEVYAGRAARDILGLPDHHVRVKPDQKPGCTIFVQSTSYNRKLVSGTRLLLLR